MKTFLEAFVIQLEALTLLAHVALFTLQSQQAANFKASATEIVCLHILCQHWSSLD
jgi:hypothetical protein